MHLQLGASKSAGSPEFAATTHPPYQTLDPAQVTTTHVETRYEPDLAKIKEHFLGLVDQRVTTSERHVKVGLTHAVSACALISCRRMSCLQSSAASLLDVQPPHCSVKDTHLRQHRVIQPAGPCCRRMCTNS